MTHTDTTSTTEDVVAALADTLSKPTDHHGPLDPGQSLAGGAAGIALLHTERARYGRSEWQRAQTWLAAATGDGLHVGGDAGLFFGAPACGFVAHLAATAWPGTLTSALARLDTSITTLTRRRLAAAAARLDSGAPASFGEYDLVRGLTGLGVYHRQRGHHDVLRDVLAYLVRLTHPHPDGTPGWWTSHAPTEGDRDPQFSAGHANVGMAHGVTGPLALLALAMRDGITVPGHALALERICAWLDAWQQPHPAGPWWPYWVTRAQHHGETAPVGPGRSSWCYGTPGLARAQQLAGLALDDTARAHLGERALLGCLPEADRHLDESGLCHGLAGLLQTTWRMAHDSESNHLAVHLPSLLAVLRTRPRPDSLEFLTGTAGVALALHTGATNAEASRWDASLLLS